MARIALACALVAAAVATTGCGGSGSPASGGPGAAAEIVPADAAAFVALATDGDAEQVEHVRDLVESLPGAKEGVERMLRDALDGGTWSDDVEPAVGNEVALVVVAGSEEPIVLTQPDDVGKLEELARREPELEVRAVDGWHAVGEGAALDAFEAARGGETLADADAYGDAFDDLETDVLARFYGVGKALATVVPKLPGGAVPPSGGFGRLAGVVEALDGGLRVDGRATELAQEPPEYEPTLFERVPDDAFLVASFGPLSQTAGEARKQGLPFLPELERALGVTLDDLARVLGGESVLYARSGVGIPEVTLASKPEDPQAALATLRELAQAASGFSGAELRRTQVDGFDVDVLQVELVQVQLAVVDDAIVVTTGAAALRDFRGDGDKLSVSDRFEDALDEAGYDGETAGLLFLDFQAALPVAEGLAGLAGADVPAEASAMLERLDTLALQTRADGEGARFGAVFRTR